MAVRILSLQFLKINIMKEGFTVFNVEPEEDSICILVSNDKIGNQVNNLPWYSPIKTQEDEIGVWKIKNRN